MLAKARSDAIARRAALTAPNGFLPRLLLCSGLPKASLLTMIDRLGMMGDKSSDSEAVFSQLLVPSAASEWDIGRLGQRREVAQKLLGRLSAYLRLNEVTVKKVEAGISTTFLDWLSKNCVGNDKPRKLKNKQKSKAAAVGLSTLADASKILQILGKTEELQGKAQAEEGKPEELQDKAQAEEDLDTDLFRPGMVRMELSSDIDGFAAETAIQNCVGENEPDVLEDLLRAQAGTAAANSNPLAVESSRFTGLAVLVLRSYVKMRKPHDSLSRVVLSWVPYLSRSSGCPDLWQEMFSVHKEPLKERLDHLLSRCMTVWSSCHVEMCCEWIISKGKALEVSKCSVSRITRYLVLTSGQHSVQVDGFSARIPVMGLKNWGKSEEFVSACTNIVFENIKGAGSVQSSGDVMSRNELPDWLVLTLMLAKCGRVQMKYVCEAILQRISQPTEDLDPPLLRSVFLRLYVSNPHGMNLGIAMIRAVLMEAAEEYSTVWLDWRSPFDGQLRDIFETVMGGNGSRLVRPLVDLSKKHPLLVLRRSHLLTQFLEKDAAMAGRNAKESRGVVHGQNLTGPLDAVKSGRIVKVNVRHWGFSYSEHVWIALLDIIGAVPGPVLFSCGLSMGLLDFLNVNIRLVFVQSQLKRSEKDSRLKEKLKELFAAFQKSNKSGWEKWLLSPAAGLPSLGKTKNVMMICDFLDPQAAADLCKAPS